MQKSLLIFENTKNQYSETKNLWAGSLKNCFFKEQYSWKILQTYAIFAKLVWIRDTSTVVNLVYVIFKTCFAGIIKVTFYLLTTCRVKLSFEGDLREVIFDKVTKYRYMVVIISFTVYDIWFLEHSYRPTFAPFQNILIVKKTI